MRLPRLCLFALLALFTCLAPIGFAAEQTETAPKITLPDNTLNAAQVKELFIDMTVESITAVKGRVSLSYYDPNGEVRQLRLGKKRYGHWRITKNGRMCLQMEESREKCRIIVKEKDHFKKYIVKKNGQHQHSVSYRAFRKGNPMGL